MARFDVYSSEEGAGYLLDCQANLLSHLNTRFVLPLLPPNKAPEPARRLNPIFEIEGRSYVMVTQFAATVPSRLLKQHVTSLAAEEIAIGNAIDMLLSGY
jgi:toxin CcdB